MIYFYPNNMIQDNLMKYNNKIHYNLIMKYITQEIILKIILIKTNNYLYKMN